MIKTLEKNEPKLSEEEIEKRYWDDFNFHSHGWVETYPGYYKCKFCDRNTTNLIPTNEHSFCKSNPNIKV